MMLGKGFIVNRKRLTVFFVFSFIVTHLYVLKKILRPDALLAATLPIYQGLELSQTLFGNPKGPVELGNPNTCAETKLCLNFILFRLKK